MTPDQWDEDNGVAWTLTWYGRGTPLAADECEARIRSAYRAAQAHIEAPIYFSADEDAYFGNSEEYLGSMDELTFVENEEEALRVWWNCYGSCDTEANLRQLGFGPWIEKFGRGMIEEEP